MKVLEGKNFMSVIYVPMLLGLGFAVSENFGKILASYGDGHQEYQL